MENAFLRLLFGPDFQKGSSFKPRLGFTEPTKKAEIVEMYGKHRTIVE